MSTPQSANTGTAALEDVEALRVSLRESVGEKQRLDATMRGLRGRLHGAQRKLPNVTHEGAEEWFFSR